MIGEEKGHSRSCPHGSISDFVWAEPKSTLASEGFANNFHEDPCVFLIDNFLSPSRDVYSTQRGVCIWIPGKFEDAFDSLSQSKNRAQDKVT